MRFETAPLTIRDRVLTTIDLIATFILAVECALVAVQADLDLFGILVLAFVGAAGGSVIRDLLLGEHPPAALRDWRYAALAIGATVCVMALSLASGGAGRITPPLTVELIEAAGLAFAAVAGARKSIDYGLNGAAAVIIATINGCGGQMLRDVLSMRLPHVLHTDFYATAALAGAALMVLLVARFGVRRDVASAVAGVTILALRSAALVWGWELPHLR